MVTRNQISSNRRATVDDDLVVTHSKVSAVSCPISTGTLVSWFLRKLLYTPTAGVINLSLTPSLII